MRKKGLFIFAIILLALGLLLIQSNSSAPIQNVPATGDALPPPVANLHPDWQTFTNIASGFSFQYPETFSGNVRHPVTRPVAITAVPRTKDPVAIGCPRIKDATTSGKNIHGMTNNGLQYILYQGSDVGAGQLYSLYCYVMEGTGKYYVLDFEIRSHNGCGDGNCGAYCGTQFEKECKDLDRTKDIEGPINDIVSTFKIIK